MWQHLFLYALIAALSAQALVEEYYTTNAVCKQRHCINPVVPGLNKLSLFQTLRWKKHILSEAGQHLNFCRSYVDYDFALPVVDYSHVWNTSAHTLQDLVNDQEQEAARLYFFHISAMGLDAWDYPHPELDSSLPHNNCVRAVARMACFTYLPKANHGLSSGAEGSYIKPCKSSCENYVKECNVECCDDSVQCVFARQRTEAKIGGDALNPSSELQVVTGYADFNGPSAQCTGSAHGQHTLAGWAGAAIIALLCWSF